MNKAINKEIFNAVQSGKTCYYVDIEDSYAVSTDGAKMLIIKKENLIVDIKNLKKVEKYEVPMSTTDDDKVLLETGRMFSRGNYLAKEYMSNDKSFKVLINTKMHLWKRTVKLVSSSNTSRILVLDFMTDAVIGIVMPMRPMEEEGEIL